MSRRTLALLGATAALAFAGCGEDDTESEGTGGAAQPTETATASATPVETPQTGGSQTAGVGRELFLRTCSSCHTLSDAGSNGQVGPNLDELQPDAEQVANAIRTGPGAMPENLLQGPDLDAVAQYVDSATDG